MVCDFQDTYVFNIVNSKHNSFLNMTYITYSLKGVIKRFYYHIQFLIPMGDILSIREEKETKVIVVIYLVIQQEKLNILRNVY